MKAPAALLAWHTTDSVGSVAVAHAGRVESLEFEAFGQHAPVLLGTVLQLLERVSVPLAALEGLVVTTGPGSFTGIRVGLATAQGLAAARGWPVWTADSLAARAAAQRGGDLPLVVALDARRGELYAAVYDTAALVPRARLEPFCAAPPEAAMRITAALGADTGPERWALVGSGADLLAAECRTAPRRLPAPALPVAAALLALAQAGGCREAAPHFLEPTYLRRSDAEVRRENTL
jgi:tRNA threonylcarbamoyladenosine biosynthesis protein TsaB